MRSIHRFLRIFLVGLALYLHGCRTTKPDASQATTKTAETTNAEEEQQPAIERPAEEEPADGRFNVKNFILQRDVEAFLKKSPVFSGHFTGFALYDIGSDEMLVSHQADKYFTPASNVKILTLYGALKSFKNYLPAVLYAETADTLFLRPTGDPTLLHPSFSYQPLVQMVSGINKPIVVLWPSAELNSYGTGWMWDDYGSSYQPELSWMPIYGNVVKFEYTRAAIKATPRFFTDLIDKAQVNNGKSNGIKRAFLYNHFLAEVRYPNWAFEKSVPFKYSPTLAAQLLEDTLRREVVVKPYRAMKMDTLKGQPLDSVLRIMMQESDNFLAEQLLVMSAWKNGFDNTEAFREYMAASWLPDIDPVWIDGSGLSRYNLVRPVDKVKLLLRLYHEFGWSRIHNLFAHGGLSGTIKDWYPNRPDPDNPNMPVQPYIIAKTGTLANNHNLSGYMQTRSGKLLVFSFMNNNFVVPTNEVRSEMQSLLEKIRDAY